MVTSSTGGDQVRPEATPPIAFWFDVVQCVGLIASAVGTKASPAVLNFSLEASFSYLLGEATEVEH